MKQKLLFGFAVCITTAVIVAITLNVNFSTKSYDLSDVALANVEALASNEDGNCSCTGPKTVNSSGSLIYCRCENDTCCKDEHGCN